MTRYDEIKKRVQGTTSSQNSPAAGNRQSSYEDIKASFHPSYEEIKANPANYDDSDVDINTWFQTRLYSLIDYLLPLYSEEGKSQLVVAIGCTGGKHRSVALAEELARHVADQGIKVAVNHRDIGKL